MTLKDIKADLKQTNRELDNLIDAVLADEDQKDPGLAEAMTQILFQYRRATSNLGNFENFADREELAYYRDLYDDHPF